MMNRAASLDGPWETRQLNHVSKPIDKEPNQGGLIQIPSGAWWFLTHQGTGDWEGRALALLPVTWIDGWPIIGAPGDDGIGNMVWHATKPIAGFPTTPPRTDDEFNTDKLAPQWEWNHQPRADKWSLTQRPEYLRLRAFKPNKPNDLSKAGNTLSQRALRTVTNLATAKLDLAGMADGQQAGLCHFARTYCSIGVLQSAGVRSIVLNDAGRLTMGPALSGETIWLRSIWDFAGDSQFAYSTDGENFVPFGNVYRLTWGNYRGDRIGLYSYNDADNGYVDVDWFHYSFAAPTASVAGR
jgi:beta-xylosidase